MTNEFVVVDLEQGTSEWLAWRHQGIGSSQVQALMAKRGRGQGKENLLRDKLGNPVLNHGFQSNAMARGHQLEPEARKLYNRTSGKDVRPACVQSSRYDWLRASLDGLSRSGDAAVEIKCGAAVYRRVARDGSVPNSNYAQVQHILAVTGLDSLDFWCYWPDEPPILVPVERDEIYIQRLLDAELKFWNLVSQARSANPYGP